MSKCCNCNTELNEENMCDCKGGKCVCGQDGCQCECEGEECSKDCAHCKNCHDKVMEKEGEKKKEDEEKEG